MDIFDLIAFIGFTITVFEFGYLFGSKKEK